MNALIVGHTPEAGGAVNYKGESEHSFNRRIAWSVYNKLNKNLLLYKRKPKHKIFPAKRAIELHFNAATVEAYGCEALVIDAASAREATAFLYLLSKKFHLRNRGVKHLNEGNRGYNNVKLLKETCEIAFILEPCFNHERNIFNRENEYADFLADYLKENRKMKKSVLKSKTFYFGLLTAIAPLVPSVGEFLSENTASIGMVWGAVSILLRMVTKEKVVLVD